MENERVGPKVLVTGAGGFVGRRFCRTVVGKGFSVRPVYRRTSVENGIAVGDITAKTEWSRALEGINRDRLFDNLTGFRYMSFQQLNRKP